MLRRPFHQTIKPTIAVTLLVLAGCTYTQAVDKRMTKEQQELIKEGWEVRCDGPKGECNWRLINGTTISGTNSINN